MTVAIDAMSSAANPHAFMGVTEQGLAAIVKTRGNQDLHVILRGGTSGPNYAEEHVVKAVADIEKKRKDKFASIMVDCSRTFPFSVFEMPELSSRTSPCFKTATRPRIIITNQSLSTPLLSSLPQLPRRRRPSTLPVS